ncbi:mandelate racemase/muconate lactonizing enzyme family protein [Muricoccus vinaceus]|uniref:Mandelate racemase/muconate lactonizing enzyme family protein n=1 Tax=Muricoccus vinaceus TaxID=424704 RepID=A0ABV6IPZ9_9PROT
MKITRVTTELRQSPFTYGGDGQGGNLRLRTMATLLVRVDTDAGVTGWGEAFGFTLAEVTQRAVDALVAPLCIGQDPRDIAALTGLLHRRLHNFGRNGPASFAIAGVDIALWDIAGRLAGLPLHRLLGGPETPEVPAYASLLRYGDPDTVARNAADAAAQGFTELKLHEIDPACLRAARGAVPGLPLMIDMNCAFPAPEAIAWAAEIAPLSPRFIEEPVWPPEDFTAIAQVRAAGGLPVAAGECAGTVEEFRAMVAAGAVDVLQPSVAKLGISRVLEVAALARENGLPVVPHAPYFGPALLATAHLIAAWNQGAALECYHASLEHPPFGDALLPRDGRVALPQSAGLGLDPVPEAA